MVDQESGSSLKRNNINVYYNFPHIFLKTKIIYRFDKDVYSFKMLLLIRTLRIGEKLYINLTNMDLLGDNFFLGSQNMVLRVTI